MSINPDKLARVVENAEAHVYGPQGNALPLLRDLVAALTDGPLAEDLLSEADREALAREREALRARLAAVDAQTAGIGAETGATAGKGEGG